jgi:hypothetical protein
MENKKVKQVLSGGRYPREGGGYKGRVWEAECGGNMMYSCMKWKNEICSNSSRDEERGITE